MPALTSCSRAEALTVTSLWKLLQRLQAWESKPSAMPPSTVALSRCDSCFILSVGSQVCQVCCDVMSPGLSPALVI
jgi:hypothetical protein